MHVPYITEIKDYQSIISSLYFHRVRGNRCVDSVLRVITTSPSLPCDHLQCDLEFRRPRISYNLGFEQWFQESFISELDQKFRMSNTWVKPQKLQKRSRVSEIDGTCDRRFNRWCVVFKDITIRKTSDDERKQWTKWSTLIKKGLMAEYQRYRHFIIYALTMQVKMKHKTSDPP